MKKLIAKIENTKPYEDLKRLLGRKLGTLIYQLVNEAEKADKELDIVHQCLTELYELDSAYPRIKEALKCIEELSDITPGVEEKRKIK